MRSFTIAAILCLTAPLGEWIPYGVAAAAARASAAEYDCNGNGVEDAVDIAGGYSGDENGNGIPDECEDAPKP
ncbi:MAG: hypothetical protein JNN27_16305 [Planctomycetes bacterium]|nr:hypothetical protein [Planctomycetota bacterium]